MPFMGTIEKRMSRTQGVRCAGKIFLTNESQLANNPDSLGSSLTVSVCLGFSTFPQRPVECLETPVGKNPLVNHNPGQKTDA
jgi:hypothetical protein